MDWMYTLDSPSTFNKTPVICLQVEFLAMLLKGGVGIASLLHPLYPRRFRFGNVSCTVSRKEIFSLFAPFAVVYELLCFSRLCFCSNLSNLSVLGLYCTVLGQCYVLCYQTVVLWCSLATRFDQRASLVRSTTVVSRRLLSWVDPQDSLKLEHASTGFRCVGWSF